MRKVVADAGLDLRKAYPELDGRVLGAPHPERGQGIEIHEGDVGDPARVPPVGEILFASGNGSNFEALAAAADGRIAARIALMVCDKPGAFVNEAGCRYGIPTFYVQPQRVPFESRLRTGDRPQASGRKGSS